MSKVRIKDKEFVPYISADEIQSAAQRVARQIDECYAGTQEPVVMLITLAGAMMFAADLNRFVDTPMEWAFVKCSSYAGGMQSSGDVKFDIPLLMDIAGRDVLVVEDTIDTGNTLEALYAYLADHKPRSLRIATFAIKRDVYKKELPIDFVGLELEDKFLIGYGLDYCQIGRNLNEIYQLTSC